MGRDTRLRTSAVGLLSRNPVRIATWNLARPPIVGARTSRLLEHIAKVEADVWVLTETRCTLAPGPDFDLVAASAPAPDRGDGECWTAVWVHRSMPGERLESADPERTACARLVSPGGQVLYVYGTVLPWLTDARRLPVGGAAGFVAALAEQAADWRRLRRGHPGAALCVAGDLNQDLLARGHYYGSAAGRVALRSTLADLGLECVTGGEADPIARIHRGRASIDHLCLANFSAHMVDGAPEVRVWPDPQQLGPSLTDHHGVVVTCPSPNKGVPGTPSDHIDAASPPGARSPQS